MSGSTAVKQWMNPSGGVRRRPGSIEGTIGPHFDATHGRHGTNEGKVTEMKTGGKTLWHPRGGAERPVGRVHVVTVTTTLRATSDEAYLLVPRPSVVIYAQGAGERAYQSDITYGRTASRLDHLRDNTGADQQVQRGHAFCIVDEVDSILIDEADPLIIRGRRRRGDRALSDRIARQPR